MSNARIRTSVGLKGAALVLVALVAVDVTVGCVAESDPGSSLNPQPLPPAPPPDDEARKSAEAQEPGAFGSVADDGTGGSSSGTSGSVPNPDAGH